MRGCISGSSPFLTRRSSCGGLTTSMRLGWPTSRPGEIIRDVYGVRPPKAAEPGKYRLVIDPLSTVSASTTASLHTFEYR